MIISNTFMGIKTQLFCLFFLRLLFCVVFSLVDLKFHFPYGTWKLEWSGKRWANWRNG